MPAACLAPRVASVLGLPLLLCTACAPNPVGGHGPPPGPAQGSFFRMAARASLRSDQGGGSALLSCKVTGAQPGHSRPPCLGLL